MVFFEWLLTSSFFEPKLLLAIALCRASKCAKPVEKKIRSSEKTRLRSGGYTSGGGITRLSKIFERATNELRIVFWEHGSTTVCFVRMDKVIKLRGRRVR